MPIYWLIIFAGLSFYPNLRNRAGLFLFIKLEDCLRCLLEEGQPTKAEYFPSFDSCYFSPLLQILK